MDYIDFSEGLTEDFFWFKSKRELIEILIKKTGKSNLKILNIGAGIGTDLEIINKFGKIYVIDVNKKALDLIPPNLYVEKRICDATALPYANNYFDIVCSFDVFEHINDDKMAISEVHRVLKKRGTLLFTVPAYNFLYSAHDKALHHFRRYSLKSLISLMKIFEYGYISFWNSTLFIPLAFLRILKKTSKPSTDYFKIPSILENIFLKFLKIENRLIEKGYKIPFGLSLVGYFIK